MKRLVLMIAVTAALMSAAPAAADWSVPVGSNVVADQVIAGGGYPVPPGATRPDAGTCRAGLYNSNRSESWIAVKPGHGVARRHVEALLREVQHVLRLPSRRVRDPRTARSPAQSQVQGYDCVSTGTQAMPPSWTNNTDPNVDFDTQGPRLPDDAAVQRLLGGRAASQRRDRPLLLRRPRPALDQGQRRPRPRAQQQPDQPELRPRRGQAVGRRQPLPRHRLPGPRLRDVDDVQRSGRERQDPRSPSRATAGRRSRRRSRSLRRAPPRPRRPTCIPRSAATARSTSPSSAASTRRTRTASATSTSPTRSTTA